MCKLKRTLYAIQPILFTRKSFKRQTSQEKKRLQIMKDVSIISICVYIFCWLIGLLSYSLCPEWCGLSISNPLYDWRLYVVVPFTIFLIFVGVIMLLVISTDPLPPRSTRRV